MAQSGLTVYEGAFANVKEEEEIENELKVLDIFYGTLGGLSLFILSTEIFKIARIQTPALEESNHFTRFLAEFA